MRLICLFLLFSWMMPHAPLQACDDLEICVTEDEKEKYKNKGYHPPMAIPLYLAGNFCELRSNHWHTGLDIKTGGVEGKKIYAIEDGYVSRIKVGLWGYGKVVYVTHPDGYTSVYAHLQTFSDTLNALIKTTQYSRKRHEVELFPEKGAYPVKKGEVIALSGNSGSSTAPHLHFEIRETRTEDPVNPLLFGFDIKDTVKPTIRKIRMYPIDTLSGVNQSPVPLNFEVSGDHGNYKLTRKEPIEVTGKIGFAIDVIDRLNGMPNKCGIYTIKLMVDSTQIYGQRLEKMRFSVNRYLNAHMDYEMWKDGHHFQRSYLLPNNKLPIYENVVDRGIYEVKDSLVHTVTYLIEDTYGNKASISFNINGSNKPVIKAAVRDVHQVLSHGQENVVKYSGMVMRMPTGILYDDLKMELVVGPTPKRAFAPLYKIHNYKTPLQSYFTLSIKADSVPPGKEDKLIIVSYSPKGKIYNEGGKFEDGWVTCKTRSFGDYSIMMDDTPPSITPRNFTDGKDMSKNTEIALKITDNLSGIESYRGEIDGQWVLFEYDPQRAKLVYVFDEHVKPGKHQLKVTVKDERGNKRVYTAGFTR